MAGETFQDLLDLGTKRDRGGRTSVEGVSLNSAIDEAEGIADVAKRNARARDYEKAVNLKIEKDMAQRAKLKEAFGTDDPKRVAAIQALGGFDQNALTQDMAVDPGGTRARFDRMVALTGHGGVQEAPDGPPPLAPGVNDLMYYRKNPETGTLEFTNRPEVAAEPGYKAYSGGGMQHPDLGAPGGDVGRIGSGDQAEVVREKPLEDVLFEGKLDQARSVVERPERKEKEAVEQEKYFDEVWKASPDIMTARERIKNDLANGILKERPNLSLAGLKAVDAAILKRAKDPAQIRAAGGYGGMFKPWKAPKKPGQDADPAQPASVVNPGGSTNVTTEAQQKNLMATSEANAQLDESLPTERQKMIDFARGKVASQSPTSKVAPGGKGKGLMEDVSGFLSGKGRAGSGESGPTGFAKDVASFYGPRLPGDILTAVGGVTAKRGLKRVGSELMKIRAIENMFGKF